MTDLSLSLSVVVCSLLLGYTFIISPAHGRKELNNEVMSESEKVSKLNRAEIQDVLEAHEAESTKDDKVAEIMVKGTQRSRSRTPPINNGIDPRSRKIRKRGRSRSPSSSGRRQRTRRVFDPRMSRLYCRERDPLSRYTHGVTRALENDVRRFLQTRTTDVDCGRGISLNQLMQMANSMLPANVQVFNVPGGQSYAYLPESRTCQGGFYRSGQNRCNNGYTCNRNFKDSEMYILYDCPNVQEYWSGWTPCFFCEQSLMDWKEDTNHRGTITIHVGKMYNWGDKPSTSECLALMIRQGFNLVPWSWSHFERYGFSNTCSDLIDLIQICQEFDNAYVTIQRQIGQADDMARRYRTADLDRMCRQSRG